MAAKSFIVIKTTIGFELKLGLGLSLGLFISNLSATAPKITVRENSKPNIEFLKFLGEWQDEKGELIESELFETIKSLEDKSKKIMKPTTNTLPKKEDENELPSH